MSLHDNLLPFYIFYNNEEKMKENYNFNTE